jgi:NADH-quinone oxidoreductase subunit L
MFQLAWLLFVFPAAAALINMLFGHRMSKPAIGWLASGAVIASFAVAIGLLFGLLGLNGEERIVTIPMWDWITIGSFHAPAAMLIDPLSVTMALVVTGVGALIHIYAIGYMYEDERFQRFFVYLNFFIFAMLILVMLDNFLGMYVGWEGVGLASYLLIGFWFDKRDDTYGYYADAGKKAFLVNRVGDFGMALAIMIVWTSLGSITFLKVFEAAPAGLSSGLATAITLLLLLAATGKSAQIPLYVWLPDAMAGPTPVSALIHAATMVTAGIYMVARTHVLWELAPFSANLAAWIGGLTALMAASIAMTQVDLKKILAYSTISQLGYMLMGVAVGAYAFGIFHLVTHAFFKALLFLAAGNVMHGLHGELDIRKMGGLRAKMPATHTLFVVGALALAGFPLMSGFFSKDGILLNVYEHNVALYAVGLFTALLTAFYSFRAVFVPFWGKPRDQHLFDHAHESPRIMTGPLWVLAFLAVVGGVINLPFVLSLEHWLEPVVGGPRFHPSVSLEITLLVVSAVVALLGIYLAFARYVQNQAWSKQLHQAMGPLARLAEHKYYVDEAYELFIVQPLRVLAGWFANVVDQRIIDGTVNLIGEGNLAAGNRLRHIHNGLVPTYALSLLVGAVIVVAYLVLGA